VNQLEGIKVLELASVLAGPAVGQFFAELGAEVIKVENLLTGGDVTRTWKTAVEQTDDRSAYFCSVNWGKRSIAIDLSRKEGQGIAQKLAAESDIVIASFKPGDAEKLGVDYQRLQLLNPGLIYGQVTGYGSDNPKVGYDAIIQAESGFMSMNGEQGGRSLKMPVALIDILAGHHLKEGLLLAMLQKLKTGEGQLVEVSLIQAAVSSLANQATNWLVGKKLPGKHGSAHPNIAPYGDVFITADGREFLLAVGNDRQFRDLCSAVGIASIADDVKFSTNGSRVRNRKELNDHLAKAIINFDASRLLLALNRLKIPAGLIQDLRDVFEMAEAKELVLQRNEVAGIKTYISGDSLSDSHFLPPPHLGEHSLTILSKSLLFSSETIQSLKSAGIVG
jgi:crotonobetainyl-CoA:carnitine CoA-transferase CaiB-like acyl-CoA transferase